MLNIVIIDKHIPVIVIWSCLVLSELLSCSAGSSVASRAASSRQCPWVCSLTRIPRHLPILRQHTGQTSTGETLLCPCLLGLARVSQWNSWSTVFTGWMETPASVATYWDLSLGNENKEDHRRIIWSPSRKIYKQWESSGEGQRELPVTTAGERNWLVNVQAGMEGTESK